MSSPCRRCRPAAASERACCCRSASAFLVLATKPAIKYTIYEQVRHALITRRSLAAAQAGAAAAVSLGVFEAVHPPPHHHHLPAASCHSQLAQQPDRNGAAVWQFALGAVSRAIAEVLIYPYTRAKMVIVGRSASKHAASKNGGGGAGGAGAGEDRASLLLPVWTIKELVVTEGFLSLYQGMGPQIIRGYGSHLPPLPGSLRRCVMCAVSC